MTANPATILRNARNKLQLNQSSFASQIGKTQGTLSRYESGSVLPPSNVIMHCIHILDNNPASDSVEEIISKVRTLQGDQYIKIREALNTLLDSFLRIP